MPKGNIIRADATTLPAWAGLSYLMYKDTHSYTDMVRECEHFLQTGAVTGFLYCFQDDYVGFVNVSLRPDTTGAGAKPPAGFVETIFVREDHRRYGFGRELICAAEQYCAANGCRQLSSDTVADNIGSQKFHEACGFGVKGRVIFYAKDI
jgi:aminoglycoside 6'-N-acetyltransferase I